MNKESPTDKQIEAAEKVIYIDNTVSYMYNMGQLVPGK